MKKQYKNKDIRKKSDLLKEKFKMAVKNVPYIIDVHGETVWDKSSDEYKEIRNIMDEIHMVQESCSHNEAIEYIGGSDEGYINGLVFCKDCDKELVNLCRKSPTLECEFKVNDSDCEEEYCIYCGRSFDESLFSKNSKTGSQLYNMCLLLKR